MWWVVHQMYEPLVPTATPAGSPLPEEAEIPYLP
jgi:hypothetical protein